MGRRIPYFAIATGIYAHIAHIEYVRFCLITANPLIQFGLSTCTHSNIYRYKESAALGPRCCWQFRFNLGYLAISCLTRSSMMPRRIWPAVAVMRVPLSLSLSLYTKCHSVSFLFASREGTEDEYYVVLIPTKGHWLRTTSTQARG